mmetsp:Transcript_11081/g.25391  ORF Transcript_11081/g.25391 Transcript_11081/m.25391 type:complete len:123 (-) Transcript_11081:672-1040(-)
MKDLYATSTPIPRRVNECRRDMGNVHPHVQVPASCIGLCHVTANCGLKSFLATNASEWNDSIKPYSPQARQFKKSTQRLILMGWRRDMIMAHGTITSMNVDSHQNSQNGAEATIRSLLNFMR